MVHGASTDAANKQLIAALSAGRNIVLDGTMTGALMLADRRHDTTSAHISSSWTWLGTSD